MNYYFLYINKSYSTTRPVISFFPKMCTFNVNTAYMYILALKRVQNWQRYSWYFRRIYWEDRFFCFVETKCIISISNLTRVLLNNLHIKPLKLIALYVFISFMDLSCSIICIRFFIYLLLLPPPPPLPPPLFSKFTTF